MIDLTKIVSRGFLSLVAAVGVGSVAVAQVAPAKPFAGPKVAAAGAKPHFTVKQVAVADAPKNVHLLKTTSVSPEKKASLEARLKSNQEAFVENRGQWDSEARYLAHTPNLRVWLTDKGWVLDAYRYDLHNKKSGSEGQVFTMEYVGGNAHPALIPNNFNGSTRDYFTPGAGKKAKGVKAYGEVLAKDVYPGIDVNSHIDQGQARFDFIVKPGADPSVAKIKIGGAISTKVNEKGQVVAETSIGAVAFGGLKAFQYENGVAKPVEVAFKQVDKDVYAFSLGEYDKTKELTIDPVAYGTYYGGDDGWDEVHAVATDLSGGVYITGMTRDDQFPRIQGPYGFNLHGAQDAFISKLQGDVYSHDYAAYFGGVQSDSGDYIAVDPNGDIWVAGKTTSSDFPGSQKHNVVFLKGDQTLVNLATGGTFTISYNDYAGQSFTVTLPYNATTAQVQTALSTAAGAAVTVTGTPMPTGTMRIDFPVTRPGVVSVDSRGTWPRIQTSELPLGQMQELTAGTPAPTGGTYSLSFQLTGYQNPITTADINWNATPAQVGAALTAAIQATTGNPNTGAVIASGGNLPAAPYYVLFVVNGPVSTMSVNTASLTGGTYTAQFDDTYTVQYDNTRSAPNGAQPGVFSLTVGPNIMAVPWNATLAQFQGLLTALPTIGTNMVALAANGFQLPGQFPPGNVTTFYVLFAKALGNGQFLPPGGAVVFPNGGTVPKPNANFTINKPSTAFMMRWKQANGGTGLDPEVGAEKTLVLDGDTDQTLAGFAISPSLDGSGRVVLSFGGQTGSEIGNPSLGTTMIPGYNNESSYLGRVAFDPTQAPASAFAWDLNVSRYIGDQTAALVRGVAVDTAGDLYVTGTVLNGGTIDTSVNPVFVTTPNIFLNGRLLRNDDIFIRKYSPQGGLLFSGLIGGEGDDVAGGWDLADDGLEHTTGTAIAVDPLGNAYVTGIAQSFDYPRTRGVFGEVFNANAVVVVTKVNSDGSQILYSTHLRTANHAFPAGIAVDERGDAFVTGNGNGFPTTAPFNFAPVVQVTADAVQATPTNSNSGYPSTDGWLNVLNSTATGLVYGTWIGSVADEEVWAPHVDNFGDCWIMGYTDSHRLVELPNPPNGVPTLLYDPPLGSGLASLPAGFITQLAFKATPSQSDLSSLDALPPNLAAQPNPRVPGSLYTVGYFTARNGFLVRFRLGLPVINSVTFDNPTIAGGLGAFTTGHVNLSGGAPAGGMAIVVTLNSTAAASFDPSLPVSQTIVNLPQGAATGTFVVYSSPVTDLTNVDVKAEFENNFKIGQLVVAPWLQQLSITPNSIVGGNAATGRIRIFQAAVPGGVNVDIASDNNALVPGGFTVNVPAGQTTVTFPINTNGVSTPTTVNVTAQLLGVGASQPLTINPASLLTLTVQPQHVNGGTAAVGTVKLDGKPGTPFTVTLSLPNGLPAGYLLNPTTVTFDPNDGSPNPTTRSFNIYTGYEPANIVRTITASRIGQAPYSDQTITGTINVDANDLTNLTVSPTTVAGGQGANLTVTIAQPAGTGGTTVTLSSSDPSVTIQAPDGTFHQVVVAVVPAGATQATVPVQTTVISNPLVVTLTAVRGGVTKTATLNVSGVSAGFSIQPGSVVGGSSATGTVTLSAPAPVGGLPVVITTDNPAAHFTTPQTIAAGDSSLQFTITTDAVATTQVANLTATVGAGSPLPASLTITAPVVSTISFNPNRLRGGLITKCTLTFNSPTPANTSVVLTNSNPRVANIGSTIPIPAGVTSYTFNVVTYRVSRPLATLVTANLNGAQVAALLTATR